MLKKKLEKRLKGHKEERPKAEGRLSSSKSEKNCSYAEWRYSKSEIRKEKQGEQLS